MANLTVKKILDHPDKDEIISKLVIGRSAKDINEWLVAKYVNVSEKKFILSEKAISLFQKEYLDLYNIIKEDLSIVKKSPDDELKETIQNNPSYHKKLTQYLDQEIDIKTMAKKLIIAIEHRASQVFDQIQEDPENIKMDRTLVEWFNTLANVLEKYDKILNGSPDQIINNNITIQMVDQHINVVYNVIKNILSRLDYDTSLMFIELFNDEMNKLKDPTEKEIVPVESRLAEAKILIDTAKEVNKTID